LRGAAWRRAFGVVPHAAVHAHAVLAMFPVHAHAVLAVHAHAVLVHFLGAVSNRRDELLALLGVQRLVKAIHRVLQARLVRGERGGDGANVGVDLGAIELARRNVVGEVGVEFLVRRLHCVGELLEVALDPIDGSLLIRAKLE
jgi:hypothetical protein